MRIRVLGAERIFAIQEDTVGDVDVFIGYGCHQIRKQESSYKGFDITSVFFRERDITLFSMAIHMKLNDSVTAIPGVADLFAESLRAC